MYIVQYTCKCLHVYHTRWNVEICYTAFLIRDMPMSGSPSCVHICTEFCIMREKGGRYWYYLYLLCIDDWEQSAIFLLYFDRNIFCKIEVLIYMLSWLTVWNRSAEFLWLLLSDYCLKTYKFLIMIWAEIIFILSSPEVKVTWSESQLSLSPVVCLPSVHHDFGWNFLTFYFVFNIHNA